MQTYPVTAKSFLFQARFPFSIETLIDIYFPKDGVPNPLPLFMSSVAAGRIAPADDHIERRVDLNTYLINNPASTFLVHVSGQSMLEHGLTDGDWLVVDKSVPAVTGSLVVVALDSDLLVKELELRDGRVWLHSANDAFRSIEVRDSMVLRIHGVVTFSIRDHRGTSKAGSQVH